jgi:predicted RNase H-like HicB family nuclease
MAALHYPILIEPGSSDLAYGVIVPDLPGCFSAGDTLDEALEATKEACAAWLDAALDDGRPIPPPSAPEAVCREGWILGVVDLDAVLFDDTIERVNITLPRRVLRRLDNMARAHGESRGALIAHLTLCHRTKST